MTPYPGRSGQALLPCILRRVTDWLAAGPAPRGSSVCISISPRVGCASAAAFLLPASAATYACLGLSGTHSRPAGSGLKPETWPTTTPKRGLACTPESPTICRQEASS